MKRQKLSGRLCICQFSLAALFALAFVGCSSSTDNSSQNNVPADIQGAPIKSAAATQTNNPSEPTEAASTAAAEPSKANQPAVAPAEPANPALQGSTGVAASSSSVNAPEEKDGEFLIVGFDKLASFNFDIPDEPPATNQVANVKKSEDQIPAVVKALDQKAVAIKGFMLPLKVESGLVTEMLIMRDQSMCCYGTVPKINEWVSVKMVEGGVKAVMDQPVTVFGKLRVGEMRENGYLVGIYQMDGRKMAGPADL